MLVPDGLARPPAPARPVADEGRGDTRSGAVKANSPNAGPAQVPSRRTQTAPSAAPLFAWPVRRRTGNPDVEKMRYVPTRRGGPAN